MDKKVDDANKSPKLSYEQLMEQLNDPALLRAAAEKQGLKVMNPIEEATAARDKPKKREIPVIKLDDSATVKDLAESLNQAIAKLYTDMEQVSEEKVAGVRTSVEERDKAKVRKEATDFAKSHADFKELLPDIDVLWRTGKYSIEEAYNKVKYGVAGKPEVKTKAGKAAPVEAEEEETASPKRASIKSDEVLAPETLKPKHTSVRDAARQNLEKILSEEGEDVLNVGEEDSEV